MAAASSKPWSAERSAPSTVMTRNGIATNVSAMTTAERREREREPEPLVEVLADEARCGRTPAAARRRRRPAAAPAAGSPGRAAARSPGTGARASTQASGTPSTSEIAVAATATISESRSASSDRLVGRGSAPSRPHGARTSRRDERQQQERSSAGDGTGAGERRAGPSGRSAAPRRSPRPSGDAGSGLLRSRRPSSTAWPGGDST